MKKGFIFSMSAIFFVALVILFFSLYAYVYQKTSYRERINVNEQNMFKFLDNQSSDLGASYQTKWCSVHLVYDPNSGLGTPSILVRKEYCENYETKRFI